MQVLLVWIAFLLMVTVSFFFVGNIARNHLTNEAKEALDYSQTKIESDLLEAQSLVASLSYTIGSMIKSGVNVNFIRNYITDFSANIIKNKTPTLGISSLYGVFDVFNEAFLNDGTWVPPETFKPRERPWYKDTIEAKGAVILTQPYLDELTKRFILTCASSIWDNSNRLLAVICIDIPIEKIAETIVTTSLSEGGYGMLLNPEFVVIAHPYTDKVGKPLREWDSGLNVLSGELLLYDNIYGRKLTNYKYEESLVFFRRLENNWSLGIVIPYKKYYREINTMRVGLVLLGLTLAISLHMIFLRIASAKAQSDEKTQQKSYFLARMSHEIRTPMNAILGLAEIQLQKESLPDDTRESFAKITNSGGLLLGIINDILDLSKIEAGKLEILPSKYDVPSLVYDTVQLNMLRFESKPVEFKLNVNESVPMELIGDELRIKQILNNLLSNAFKYTERGEVSLDVNAEYVVRGGAAHVTIIFRISDTGQGMSAEQVRKLGEEYSRFNPDINRTTEGTGLGMSITLNLINMMNGRFTIDSKPGKGTTVTVYLPQRNIGPQMSNMLGKERAESLSNSRVSKASQLQKSQITRELMPYGHVLIVDDVESNLFVAKGLMAPYELSVDTATSGFEAIEKIKAGIKYDIIFMDHMMPKMDGIEAAKIIRSLEYNNAIVALTANALAGQEELFLEKGFNGFISKPIDIRQLNALLNKLIRDKQPPGVIEAVIRKQEAKEQETKTKEEARNPELEHIFVRDAGKAIHNLEKICGKNKLSGEEDIQTYIINVHAMKSALANIGETELSGIAKKLEESGREQNITLITAETPAFINALQELIWRIRSKENAAAAPADMNENDSALLIKKLEEINAACLNYDKKEAKKTLAELRNKAWPQPVKDLLETVSELLLHSEFEKAADITEKYTLSVTGANMV
jgi:signal transduction histidine kinase/DNA-binding response OmpR family regulator